MPSNSNWLTVALNMDRFSTAMTSTAQLFTAPTRQLRDRAGRFYLDGPGFYERASGQRTDEPINSAYKVTFGYLNSAISAAKAVFAGTTVPKVEVRDKADFSVVVTIDGDRDAPSVTNGRTGHE